LDLAISVRCLKKCKKMTRFLKNLRSHGKRN
jgi:hypothetical protein